jgi:hypothetical protein
MPALEYKLHHKVARFYLKSWDEKGRDSKHAQVFCLQDGKVRLSNLKNIAAENYFYRLRQLNESDVKFIREIAITGSPEQLKPYHERLLCWFLLPHEIRHKIGNPYTDVTSQLAQNLDAMIVGMNERLHTSIEEDFKPFLEHMLNGDSGFYAEPPAAAKFLRGIAAQYLRTDLTKKAERIWKSGGFEVIERTANILVHIFSINLGFSLYADRERYKLVILENHTNIPFVTTDQPVINIAANPSQTKPPDKFELYYPLSPTKAMLLVEPSSDHFACNLSAMSVNVYNSHMAAHSYQQIYANSRHVLEALSNDLSAIRSSFNVTV